MTTSCSSAACRSTTPSDAPRQAGQALRATPRSCPTARSANARTGSGCCRGFIYTKHPGFEETLAPPGHTLVQPERGRRRPAARGAPGHLELPGQARLGGRVRRSSLRDARVESYRGVPAAARRGRDRPGVRFQMSPAGRTARSTGTSRTPTTGPRCTGPTTTACASEIALALTEIPADDLVIQWDVAWEFVDMAIGDKRCSRSSRSSRAEEKFQRYAAQLDDLWQGIPDETLLGYHWCYGTWGGWPMVALGDLALCVRMSNEAERRTGRRLDYVHMPVVRHPDEVLRPARRPRRRRHQGLPRHGAPHRRHRRLPPTPRPRPPVPRPSSASPASAATAASIPSCCRRSCGIHAEDAAEL